MPKVDTKIKTTVAFTRQELSWITSQAKRRGISFGDCLRRIIDTAMDAAPPVKSTLADMYKGT